MLSKELSDRIFAYTLQNSGIEHKNYLCMSRIGYCPRQLYMELAQGREFSNQSHLHSYLSCLFKRDVLSRLSAVCPDLLGPAPELSGYGNRFRGRPDAVWDGDLVVVRSVDTARRLPGYEIPRLHYTCVQTYLLYGNFLECKCIYVARDTGQFKVVHILRERQFGERMKEKAGMVLEAVDRGRAPECECGKCGQPFDRAREPVEEQENFVRAVVEKEMPEIK